MGGAIFPREYGMGGAIFPIENGGAKFTGGVPISLGNLAWGCHIPWGAKYPVTPGFLFPSWPGLLISFLARASYFLPGPGFLFPSWPGLLISFLARASYFLPGQGFLFPSWPGLLISFLARASYFLPGPGFLFPSWSRLLISFLARASYFLPGQGFLFPSWPFSTWPLNEAGLYMGLISILAAFFKFFSVLFTAQSLKATL